MEKEHVVLHLGSYLDLQGQITDQTNQIEKLSKNTAILANQTEMLTDILRNIVREEHYVQTLKRQILSYPNDSYKYEYDQVMRYSMIGENNYPEQDKEKHSPIIEYILHSLIEEFKEEAKREARENESSSIT